MNGDRAEDEEVVSVAESICLSATFAKPQAACRPCGNSLLEEALVPPCHRR